MVSASSPKRFPARIFPCGPINRELPMALNPFQGPPDNSPSVLFHKPSNPISSSNRYARSFSALLYLKTRFLHVYRNTTSFSVFSFMTVGFVNFMYHKEFSIQIFNFFIHNFVCCCFFVIFDMFYYVYNQNIKTDKKEIVND